MKYKIFCDESNHLLNTKSNLMINGAILVNEDKVEEINRHIITKDEYNRKARNNPCLDAKERNRKYDVARATRIHWIKIIIDAWQVDSKIKHFYKSHLQINRIKNIKFKV